jgi:uncharacterized protein (TIGR03000 family)
MKRLLTRILVIPALLLLVTSEANAQRFGFGGNRGGYGPGYGNYGYGNYGNYGTYGPGYGYNSIGSIGYGYGNPYGNYGYGSGPALTLGNNYYNYNRSGYGGFSNYGTYNNGVYNGYNNPVYYNGSMPLTSNVYSQPIYSNGIVQTTAATTGFEVGNGNRVIVSPNGIAQTSYTTPVYSTNTGIIQAGTWSSPVTTEGIMAVGSTMTSTPMVAKVKLTVPNNAEVWVDGKQSEGSGTTREFTTDAISSWTQVKLKIKSGDSTREFTMPVRPGEDSKVDITPLLQ